MAEAEKIDKRPSIFDAGVYNIQHLRYPENVATDPSQAHYAVFYVNVPEGKGSSLAGEKQLGIVSTRGETNVNTGNAATTVLSAAGAVAGAAASLSALKKLNSLGGNVALKTTALLVGGATVAGAVAASEVFKKTQYVRISDAITLGLVNVPMVSYNAMWEDTSLGTIGGLLAGGSSAADASIGAVGADIGKLALRNAIKIPGSSKMGGKLIESVGGLNGAGVSGSINKEVPNPFREQIFQQVSNRYFTFTVHFMPKSRNEAKMVKNIIEKFKFHMHPDLSDTGIFYKFPSQFDIVYYFNGEENKNLNKISTCVLERCDIKYGADGNKFASFVDGALVETTMSLSFKEIEVMTKARIKEGF